MLDIVKIMRHAGARLFQRIHFAAQPIHLGPAGDPRLDPMAMRISVDRIALKAAANLHLHGMRAGADQ